MQAMAFRSSGNPFKGNVIYSVFADVSKGWLLTTICQLTFVSAPFPAILRWHFGGNAFDVEMAVSIEP
jgi:hypothetical protein